MTSLIRCSALFILLLASFGAIGLQAQTPAKLPVEIKRKDILTRGIDILLAPLSDNRFVYFDVGGTQSLICYDSQFQKKWEKANFFTGESFRGVWALGDKILVASRGDEQVSLDILDSENGSILKTKTFPYKNIHVKLGFSIDRKLFGLFWLNRADKKLEATVFDANLEVVNKSASGAPFETHKESDSFNYSVGINGSLAATLRTENSENDPIVKAFFLPPGNGSWVVREVPIQTTEPRPQLKDANVVFSDDNKYVAVVLALSKGLNFAPLSLEVNIFDAASGNFELKKTIQDPLSEIEPMVQKIKHVHAKGPLSVYRLFFRNGLLTVLADKTDIETSQSAISSVRYYIRDNMYVAGYNIEGKKYGKVVEKYQVSATAVPNINVLDYVLLEKIGEYINLPVVNEYYVSEQDPILHIIMILADSYIIPTYTVQHYKLDLQSGDLSGEAMTTDFPRKNGIMYNALYATFIDANTFVMMLNEGMTWGKSRLEVHKLR